MATLRLDRPVANERTCHAQVGLLPDSTVALGELRPLEPTSSHQAAGSEPPPVGARM